MASSSAANTDWKSLLEQSRNAPSDENHYLLFVENVSLIKNHLPHLPALRLAYSLVSFQTLTTATRQRIQSEAYEAWREPIIDLLTSEYEDDKKKSRSIAAKVMCNLVTDNIATSDHLTGSLVQLDPDEGAAISSKKFNWVDLILSSRSDRLALAPVVACLFNCMKQKPSLSKDIECSSTLLVPTLLCQLIGSGGNQERDAASDWISLIITQLSIANVYETIAKSMTVPEHVVLLLVYKTALEEKEVVELKDLDRKFLVDLFLSLEKKTVVEDDSQDESVCHLILEILCEDLLLCKNPKKEVWGPDVLSTLLGRTTSIVDSWNTSASLSRHRTLSTDTQRWLINSVRSIGLLCNNSRVHQDLLRTTMMDGKRSGLHILLSTTSLAPACFTVREWAVVAIRYALEDCPANQAAVEQLQAGDAVQSADLDDMGVRVQMHQGKVSVVPLEDCANHNEDKETT